MERQKLLVQINNFKFNKGKANETEDFKRKLERNMLEDGEHIHCEKALKKIIHNF